MRLLFQVLLHWAQLDALRLMDAVAVVAHMIFVGLPALEIPGLVCLVGVLLFAQRLGSITCLRSRPPLVVLCLDHHARFVLSTH